MAGICSNARAVCKELPCPYLGRMTATPPHALLRAVFARLMAVLLLATIGLQAAAPEAFTLHHERGSAFSALTADVSLAPRQADQTAKRLLPLPDPLPTLPPAPALVLVTVTQPQAVAVVIAPASLPLPPRERPEVPTSPREPPLS